MCWIELFGRCGNESDYIFCIVGADVHGEINNRVILEGHFAFISAAFIRNIGADAIAINSGSLKKNGVNIVGSEFEFIGGV